MSQISQLDDQIAKALNRLRSSLSARKVAESGEPDLQARVASLESENADLQDELERLRVKRDKDVAALDDLIAQLKPLIEEV